MATAGFILGIIGLLLGFVGVGIIPAILGVIFSGISLRKGKNGLNIAGLVCAIIGILISLIAMSGSFGGSDGESETYDNVSQGEGTAEEAEGSIEDLVDVQIVETQENGILCAFITNNSDKTIGEADFKILFKDADGNTIDFDTDGHDVVLPGTTVVSRFSAPDEYDTYEVEKDIDASANSSYKNHLNSIEVSSNEGSDGLIIEITNNGDIEIDEVEYDVVYYKGDEVVEIAYPQDVYHVAAGDTVTEKEYYPSSEYDRYEIYINQAHTF